MGWAGVALQLVSGLASAGAQAKAGQDAKREADYNASLIEKTLPVYDTQMSFVDKEKELMNYQTNRQMNQVVGSTIARTAGKGLGMSGSPTAIMLDTYTQMEIDRRINQSNLDLQKYNIGLEKSRAKSQADALRRGGKTALAQGYTNAFTTALQSGASAASRMNTSGGAKYADTSSGRVLVAPNNYYQRAGRF